MPSCVRLRSDLFDLVSAGVGLRKFGVVEAVRDDTLDPAYPIFIESPVWN